MIRVIVADDHNLVRQGIRALLDKADDIEVVGEAGDGQAAIELVERLSPDVLVTDISMPRLNGTQTIERLHSMQSPTRVIILSMYSDETVVRQA
ncbi:MAG TPA: response regulator transcription factor, partial [Anaerolineales bacterium]|nr:response regulator transcription factor [Anaerolineales bacterium]